MLMEADVKDYQGFFHADEVGTFEQLILWTKIWINEFLLE